MNNLILPHGGALDVAMSEYGGDADDWLDMSTGINPYYYPIGATDLQAWTQLPQKSAENDLLNAACAAYGCERANIMAANGTQQLIEKLPQIFAPSTIAIMSPTYEEHAHVWRKFGHEVILVDDIEQAKQADHLLIVNPNNPTGKLFTREALLEIHGYFSAKGGSLIVDEAFIDMTPENSLSGCAGLDGLIILRSFGKFFGLAGVRIGFVLAAEAIIQQMQTQIGLWQMAGPSMKLATSALNDVEWQQEMRLRISADMDALIDILQGNGFGVVGRTDLFCLVTMSKEAHDAVIYFEKLAKHHILVRKFDNNDKILRFGLLEAERHHIFTNRLQQFMRSLNDDH